VLAWDGVATGQEGEGRPGSRVDFSQGARDGFDLLFADLRGVMSVEPDNAIERS